MEIATCSTVGGTREVKAGYWMWRFIERVTTIYLPPKPTTSDFKSGPTKEKFMGRSMEG